ncbi:hypothetical protein BJV78DRAFT_768053 [Lactifluus subvellereus]|nr:hypothetical protein BJV78DRAFT_768053 [Lactifluus subvellereus]
MPAIVDVKNTYGAILLGCFGAAILSGILSLQTCLYFRLYPKDRLPNKALVVVVWVLDATHTCLIFSSAWTYLIANFGEVEEHGVAAYVPLPLALSIAATVVVTLITHLYFLRRLLNLSHNNWFIVGPLLVLAIARGASGLVATVELARLGSFIACLAKYKSVITLGPSIAAAVDIGITAGMCFYLQEQRIGFGTMDEVIDTLIVYTINNGSLTCIYTIVVLICWLILPHTLVFIGLHFALSKLYANSVLAMLNMRQALRVRSNSFKETGHRVPVLNRGSSSRSTGSRNLKSSKGSIDLGSDGTVPRGLHIVVEKTVQYGIAGDDGHQLGPSSGQNLSSTFQLGHADV